MYLPMVHTEAMVVGTTRQRFLFLFVFCNGEQVVLMGANLSKEV